MQILRFYLVGQRWWKIQNPMMEYAGADSDLWDRDAMWRERVQDLDRISTKSFVTNPALTYMLCLFVHQQFFIKIRQTTVLGNP